MSKSHRSPNICAGGLLIRLFVYSVLFGHLEGSLSILGGSPFRIINDDLQLQKTLSRDSFLSAEGDLDTGIEHRDLTQAP
jgi:hypothetical protein